MKPKTKKNPKKLLMDSKVLKHMINTKLNHQFTTCLLQERVDQKGAEEIKDKLPKMRKRKRREMQRKEESKDCQHPRDCKLSTLSMLIKITLKEIRLLNPKPQILGWR